MRAAPRAFLDTNILVYAFALDPRSAVAKQLLGQAGVTSVQGLNEFANVARRKLGMGWHELREALELIRTLCHAVLPLDLATHAQALDIAQRYQLAIFDSLMVASALQGGCDVLFSEDMQHGLLVEGRLRIVDPFAPPLPARRGAVRRGRA